MLPAIALLRFRHAQISFLFLGASSTSLSLASSFPPLPHKLDRIIKFAVVRGATFKLQETFSSFLASCNSCNGEVAGALGGSHLGQEQEQDPHCI
jgi:hypothetical protein